MSVLPQISTVLLAHSVNYPTMFQLFLEHAPVSVAMFDREMRYIAVSHRWLSDYGLKRQNLIGQSYYELFPETSEQLKVIHQRCLTGYTQIREAQRIVRADGSTDWIKLESSPWYDDNNQIGGVIIFSEVITEKKRIEGALRASENRFQKLAANLPGVIYQFLLRSDNSMFFPYISYGCRRLLELEPKAVEQNAQLLFDRIHPDDLQSCLDSMRLSADTLLPWIWEGRILTPSGKMKWVRGISRPEMQSSGDILWDGMIVEITDRVKIEQQLHHSREDLEITVTNRTIELEKANEKLQAEIIERKQTEVLLKNSEARFRKLAANVPGMIYQYVMRPDGTHYFAYVSSGCRELYELEPEDIQKNINCLINLIHEDDKLSFEESIKVSANTLQPWSHEHRITTPSGRMKWVEGNSRPEKEANGDIIWSGLVIDITERKQVEEDRQKFVSLVENSSDFIAIATHDAQLLFVNEAGQKLVGLEGEKEYLKTTIADFHTPEDWDYFCKYILPEMVEKGCWHGESRFRHFKTGENIPIEYNTFVIKDQKTGNTLAYATVTRDITERKQAEAALKQSEVRYRELAKREQLLNRLASQIRESLDLDTVLETAIQEIRNLLNIDRCSFSWLKAEVNPPVWETVKEAKNKFTPSLLGCDLLDQVGQVTDLLLKQEVLQIDDVDNFTEPVHKQFLQSLGIKSEMVLPIQTLSGRFGVIVCAHWRKTRAWTPDEVELLQAVVDQLAIAIQQAEFYAQTQQTAIAAQEQTQKIEHTLQKLQRTQSQLIQSEKMSSLGQLVAGVAHEINNPVNFIYGNLEHANLYTKDILGLIKLYQETYPQPSPEIEDEIEAIDLDFLISDFPSLMSSIKVGAQRIKEIVQSLRTFSRLDEAEMKEVDIHEGIESTLMILQNRLKPKPSYPGIEIFKEYGKLPRVSCYAGQLNQVFMNLLANAIDALEDRINQGLLTAPTIQIKTEILDSKFINIHIADNGGGMNSEVQKRLFDPFFTTKPIGVGTGLGLSISYQIIVEKHKGKLHCHSDIGKGTEFVIEIPVSQKEKT